jgi:hypothetical protein
MFLRNFWYDAAYDHEVGREPLGWMILGDPGVFFHKEDGVPVAFEDRSAHRHLFPCPWVGSSATPCNAAITVSATTPPAPA